DLKACIPVLFREGLSIKEICHQLGIKKSFVYQVLCLYNQFGVVSNPHNYSCAVGCPCSLNQADLAFLSALLDHWRSHYLDELQDELQLKHGVCATLLTLYHALQQPGISHKIISAHVYEQNKLLWAMYMNCIAEEVPDPGMLMFIDEAAKNERTLSRRYGRLGKGVHCVVQR
ncbi:hypothetical protein OG21DRAFT_1370059, partial [Imleria badia]